MTKSEALKNWTTLNTFLRTCAKASDVADLLQMEKDGARRFHILARVHETFNKLRSREEFAELEKIGMRRR